MKVANKLVAKSVLTGFSNDDVLLTPSNLKTALENPNLAHKIPEIDINFLELFYKFWKLFCFCTQNFFFRFLQTTKTVFICF